VKLPSNTTARAVEEWIGKKPDTPIPARVILRIWDRQNGKCAKSGAKLFAGRFIKEHVKPLWAGGENRESNIKLYAIEESKEKTKVEAGSRAKADRVRKKHIMPKQKSKMQSRGFSNAYKSNDKQLDWGEE
jgi:5-methylcytosine-specific restriction enzyme A